MLIFLDDRLTNHACDSPSPPPESVWMESCMLARKVTSYYKIFSA